MQLPGFNQEPRTTKHQYSISPLSGILLLPSFLSPLISTAFVIAGAAAIAGPVIIHLLNRRRFRVVDWAAMDFLREALQRNRRVLHLRDILLLILRTLCVMFFVAAMARPYFSRSQATVGPDEAIHAVLLVDNSLSMGYERLDGTLLDEAKAKCREFINRLPRGSQISIVPLCAGAGELTWDPYRTKQDAIEALNAIVVVDRSASGAEAANRALEACKRAPEVPAKRVALIGDQQAINWPDGSAEALKKLPEVQIVQVAPQQPENAWIVDFHVQDGIADVETSTQFLTTVRYEGPEPETVQVTLSVDGTQVSDQTLELQPGQSHELTFPYRFEMATEPGRAVFATAKVAVSRVGTEKFATKTGDPVQHEGERLPADDERHLVIPVVAALPVVFVDQYGDEEDPKRSLYGETYRLRQLLAPVTTRGDYGRQLIQVRRKKVDQLDRETLRDARLVVVAGIKDPEIMVPLLRAYVQQGGRLVIAAGAEFDPKAWNSTAWLDGLGILPAPLKTELVGRLPEEMEQLSFFQLDFDSVKEVDYFKIEKASHAELLELYQLPIFFKAAAVEVNSETVKTLVAAETKQIEETRKFLASLAEKMRIWTEAEARGTLSAAERDERQLGEQRRSEVAPNWLLWPQFAATDASRASALELAQRSAPRVKASYTNGLPFLVERNIGLGKVLFFSSGIQSEWNNLGTIKTVLIYDRILRELLQQTIPAANEDTIEQVRVPLEPNDRLNRFTLTRPGGEIEDLAVDALGGDQYGVTIRNLGQRGIYRIVAHRSESGANEGQDSRLWEKPLSINGPTEESELHALDEAAMKARLGEANYRWIASTDAISLEGAVVSGQFMWRWFMALMLVMLLVELTVLAWPTFKTPAVGAGGPA